MEARSRSAVTLSVLAVVLVVMAVVGWRSATTAFPSTGSETAAACTKTEVKSVIYRKEITVSVYNASEKSGFAEATMASMERRNFVVGTIGNAPDGTKVDRVEVRTTVKNDPRATLVAEQYKPAATIAVSDDALGAGIDVILGPDAPRPVVPAPRSLKLDRPVRTCIDVPSASPSSK